jgi:hypothetical protein
MKAAIGLAKRAIAGEKAFGVYFPDPAKEMAELGSAVMADEGVRYWISPGGDSITCTKCHTTSHNPNDVEKRYCGSCHVFLDEPAPQITAADVIKLGQIEAGEMPTGKWERNDACKAFALFESMGTDELLQLQEAHQMDQAQAANPESIVFGAGRLALIAEVLKRRRANERAPQR